MTARLPDTSRPFAGLNARQMKKVRRVVRRLAAAAEPEEAINLYAAPGKPVMVSIGCRYAVAVPGAVHRFF